MNGNPHKAILAVIIDVDVTGSDRSASPIHRRSWACLWVLIILPAQINKSALNRAWITIWINASCGNPRPILVIIIPSCLKVDSAIIFFMSHSVVALIPAMIIVDTAINRMNSLNK